MKLKRFFARLLPLTLCAALLVTGAAGSGLPLSPSPDGDSGKQPTSAPATIRIWGTLTKLEDGGIRVQNNNEGISTLNDIILHISEDTLILGAVDGMPISLDDLKDGDLVYAYANSATNLSMPRQSTAVVILSDIPADFGVPAYYEVTDFSMISTMMTENNIINATVATDWGKTLHFNLTDKLDEAGNRQYILKDEITFLPYLTRNIVTVTDLIPGTRILVWSDYHGTPTKVMIFPYQYRGYLTVYENNALAVNDRSIATDAIIQDGIQYLPLRAVCEALDLTVTWDGTAKTVVVAQPDAENGVVFTYAAGGEAAQTEGGTHPLSAGALVRADRFYLPANDLADLLNLYLTR